MKSAASLNLNVKGEYSPFHTKGLKFYSMSNGELYGYVFLWIVIIFAIFMVIGCIFMCAALCIGGGAAAGAANKPNE